MRGQGFTPERLIAPHTIPVEEQRTQPAGEKLIENLLEKADAAVVIGEPSFLLSGYIAYVILTRPISLVPLRNTSLPHLRDGFSRALVARMKVPSVAAAFDEQAGEVSCDICESWRYLADTWS